MSSTFKLQAALTGDHIQYMQSQSILLTLRILILSQKCLQSFIECRLLNIKDCGQNKELKPKHNIQVQTGRQ